MTKTKFDFCTTCDRRETNCLPEWLMERKMTNDCDRYASCKYRSSGHAIVANAALERMREMLRTETRKMMEAYTVMGSSGIKAGEAAKSLRKGFAVFNKDQKS